MDLWDGRRQSVLELRSRLGGGGRTIEDLGVDASVPLEPRSPFKSVPAILAEVGPLQRVQPLVLPQRLLAVTQLPAVPAGVAPGPRGGGVVPAPATAPLPGRGEQLLEPLPAEGALADSLYRLLFRSHVSCIRLDWHLDHALLAPALMR